MPVPLDTARWMNDIVDDGHGGDDRDEQLLVRELLPIDQLERHARDLSHWHRIDRQRGTNMLLSRLADNAAIIERTRDGMAKAMAGEGRVPPAGEWLLDNAYVIEEDIRLARRHLPRSYSSELPRLTSGPEAGSPRVYALALEYIAHVDGRVESTSLDAFIAAYQEEAPLALGELWAVPIVLRLALIENMRRICVHLHRAASDQAQAALWAGRLLAQAERSPHDLVLVVADLARASLRLSPAFVAEFVRRLTGQPAGVTVALSWVESRLAAASTTTDQQVARERQIQAADQVSIAATIGSLRMLEALEWRTFVEMHAVVERILTNDPAGAYAQMDFATRDRCRHAVESLARRSRREEREVAERVVALAAAASGRHQHVGWWLIEAGHAQLAGALGARVVWSQLPRALVVAMPLSCYLGGAALITMLLLTALAAVQPLAMTPGLAAFLAVAGVLAFSVPALAIMQRVFAVMVPPRPLPRLDFSKGIPATQRTVVAVPCLLTSTAEIDRLIDQMEVRYLTNRDPQLAFVLLSDLRDADRAECPEDAALITHAQTRIAGLNRLHRDEDASFLLLHRPRQLAPAQGVWMGRERKRGKLADLNQFLRTEDDRAFSVIEGDRARLRGVRAVIVLDADTQLPPGAAAKLVGALAHPLNRPVIDPERKVVVAGHGLIQPRVAVTLSSAQASTYARMCAGEAGIDPYTRAVSDTYQDAFDEGSFVGKGIYEIEAFETVLHQRFLTTVFSVTI